jgi:hypothetical protein
VVHEGWMWHSRGAWWEEAVARSACKKGSKGSGAFAAVWALTVMQVILGLGGGAGGVALRPPAVVPRGDESLE